jgi:hypothetical protein
MFLFLILKLFRYRPPLQFTVYHLYLKKAIKSVIIVLYVKCKYDTVKSNTVCNLVTLTVYLRIGSLKGTVQKDGSCRK